jgi:hypothetical protein
MRTLLFCTLITTIVYGLSYGWQVLLNPFKRSLTKKALTAASEKKSFSPLDLQGCITINKRYGTNCNSIRLERPMRDLHYINNYRSDLEISVALIDHTTLVYHNKFQILGLN